VNQGGSADFRNALEHFSGSLGSGIRAACAWDQKQNGERFNSLTGSCEPGSESQSNLDFPEFKAAQTKRVPAAHFGVSSFEDVGGVSLQLKAKHQTLSLTTKIDDMNRPPEVVKEDRPGMNEEEQDIAKGADARLMPQGICSEDRKDLLGWEHTLRYHLQVEMPVGCRANWTRLIKQALGESPLRRKATERVSGVFFQPSEDGTGGTLFVKGARLAQVRDLAWRFPDLPDVEEYLRFHEMSTTDHNDMCATYGVEAALQSLLKELCRLFKPYGVDFRWLSLIADRCMQHGHWLGFDRFKVIANTPSLYCRMTYETALRVLERSTRYGMTESLRNPSARVMVGDWSTGNTATIRHRPAMTVKSAGVEMGREEDYTPDGEPDKKRRRPNGEASAEHATEHASDALLQRVLDFCRSRPGARHISKEKALSWVTKHSARPDKLMRKLAEKFPA